MDSLSISQEQKNKKKMKAKKKIHGSSPTTKRKLYIDPHYSKRCEYPNIDSKTKQILQHFVLLL